MRNRRGDAAQVPTRPHHRAPRSPVVPPEGRGRDHLAIRRTAEKALSVPGPSRVTTATPPASTSRRTVVGTG